MFLKKFLALGAICIFFGLITAIEEPRERLEEKERLETIDKELKTKIDSYDERRDKEKASEEINELAKEKLELVEKLKTTSIPNSSDWKFYSEEIGVAEKTIEAVKKKDISSLKRISESIQEIENIPTETGIIDNRAFQEGAEKIQSAIEGSPRKQILNKLEAFYLSTKADFFDAVLKDKTKPVLLRKELIKIYEQLGKTDAIEKQRLKIFQARISEVTSKLELIENALKKTKNNLENAIYKAQLMSELIEAVDILSMIKQEARLSSTANKKELISSIDQILEKYKAASYSEGLVKNSSNPNYILESLANNPKLLEKIKSVKFQNFLQNALQKLNEATKLSSSDPQKADFLQKATNLVSLANMVLNPKIYADPSSLELSIKDAKKQRDTLDILADMYIKLAKDSYAEARHMEDAKRDTEGEGALAFVIIIGFPITVPTLIALSPLLITIWAAGDITKKISIDNAYKASSNYANKAKELREYADNLTEKYRLPIEPLN